MPDFPQIDSQVAAGVPPARSQQKSSLLLFFFLAYALMWACFISVAKLRIPANTVIGYSLLLLGAIAPSLAAIFVTKRSEGSSGVRALLAPIFQGQVAARWYVFAVGYIVAVKLIATVLYRILTGAWPHFGTTPLYVLLYVLPFAVLISTPFQAGEEVGWRGYALPRMAQRFGLGPASVLLGFIWAFWHLPQFFIPETDTYGQSFAVFVIQVTAMSVAMAWLWARSNRSLLLTMLMHASVNNLKDIVPAAVPGAHNTFRLNASLISWLGIAILWIFAAYFLMNMPKYESIQDS